MVPTLTTLLLGSTQIGNHVHDFQYLTEALKINTSITSLSLTYISPNYEDNIPGLLNLLETLILNTTIRTLNLSLNEFGINPEVVQSLSELVKSNNTITDLNLSRNVFGFRNDIFMDNPAI